MIGFIYYSNTNSKTQPKPQSKIKFLPKMLVVCFTRQGPLHTPIKSRATGLLLPPGLTASHTARFSLPTLPPVSHAVSHAVYPVTVPNFDRVRWRHARRLSMCSPWILYPNSHDKHASFSWLIIICNGTKWMWGLDFVETSGFYTIFEVRAY